MPWWAWIALGAGGWLVVAVAVAFGAARLIAAADRATRPEIAADASNKVGQAVTPGCASPDGSGQTRGQYGPSPEHWVCDDYPQAPRVPVGSPGFTPCPHCHRTSDRKDYAQ